VNGTGEEGMSPLIWAVDCGELGGVRALLDAGANPNQAKTGTYFDESEPPTRFIVGRYSPVYLAVEKKNPAVIRLLLMHGGDPNTTKDDNPGNSALVLAWQRDRDDLKLLLDADKEISRAAPYNKTLAARAAIAGDFETVEDLLKRGYSYELKELARLVQNFTGPYAYVPPPQQVSARERVIEILKQRGIEFPVVDFIRVAMTTSGLIVAWGDAKSWHGFIPAATRQFVSQNDPLYAELLKVTGKLKPGESAVVDPNVPPTQ
jgi:ankyrin repeat protein